MYATKRKFHNLLNSIANNALPNPQSTPETSNSDTATDATPLPKRRRVEHHTASSTFSAPRSTIRDTQGKAVAIPSTNGKGPHKLPNYAPWDRGQFLERLKTFRHVDKWSTKPARVNEVQWAKRGWRCVGVDRVGCVGGCAKEVVIKLERDPGRVGTDVEENGQTSGNGEHGEHLGEIEGENQEESYWLNDIDEALVDRYEAMIVTEHAESCLWRVRGCDETIHRLPLSNPQDTLSAFQSRLKSLSVDRTVLPNNIVSPPSENLDFVTRNADRLLEGSISTHSASDTPNSDVDTRALSLALFGWQMEEGHVTGVATCNACFRRLGLWLFASASGAESTEESAAPALDVVADHREYCPWVSAESQSADGSAVKELAVAKPQLAGSEIVARALRIHLRSKDGVEASQGLSSAQKSFGERSVESNESEEEDIDVRLQKDKERWAKLKQLRKVFVIKRKTPKSASNVKPSATA